MNVLNNVLTHHSASFKISPTLYGCTWRSLYGILYYTSIRHFITTQDWPDDFFSSAEPFALNFDTYLNLDSFLIRNKIMSVKSKPNAKSQLSINHRITVMQILLHNKRMMLTVPHQCDYWKWHIYHYRSILPSASISPIQLKQCHLQIWEVFLSNLYNKLWINYFFAGHDI